MTTEVDRPAPRTRRVAAAVDERQVIASLEVELHLEFPSVPADQVSTLVQCLWSHYDGAPVRDFVALLVRKQAREELVDHVGSRAHGPDERRV